MQYPDNALILTIACVQQTLLLAPSAYYLKRRGMIIKAELKLQSTRASLFVLKNSS